MYVVCLSEINVENDQALVSRGFKLSMICYGNKSSSGYHKGCSFSRIIIDRLNNDKKNAASE